MQMRSAMRTVGTAVIPIENGFSCQQVYKLLKSEFQRDTCHHNACHAGTAVQLISILFTLS